MTFIDMHNVAESLADYIEDMQLKVQDNSVTILMVNNSENYTNLKDWLLEVEATGIKITYDEDFIKLALS